LLDAGDSVSELPLPVIPEAIYYIPKESVSGRGYFTRRLLLQIIRDAAFARRVLFRVTVATGFQEAFL
jgi:hypothetical protein